jgi:hypothetical protein
MPHFYSQYLGGTLKDRFEACLKATPSEQVAVYEELALLRIASAEAVALFNGATQLPDDNDNKAAILTMATANMQDALHAVVKVCESAANIEAKAKDKVSVIAIMMIVEQVVRIAYDVLGDDMEKAERFEKMIRENVRLPGAAHGGGEGAVSVEQLVMQAEKAVVDSNVIEGYVANS